MSPAASWHRRLKDRFFEVSPLPPREREAYLARLEAAEPDLARELRELVERAPSLDQLATPLEPELPPSGSLGPYRLLRRLGEGGMGVVYQAHDSRLDRVVAIKVLSAGLTRVPPARTRLMREARAVASLDHPNLCSLLEVGQTESDQVYLVMGYYEGETLRERLSRGALPIAEAVEIAAQIAQGLAHAHDRGITHRDLTPGNVLLGGDGRVRLLDFGLARLSDGESLTGTGAALGTPGYMAPEQIRSSAVDPRADLWSLGVLLYEMLAGRPPFAGDHPQARFYAILNDEPTPLAAVRPEIPDGLVAVVDRSLRKAPEERWPTAAALLRGLREVVPGAGGGELPQSSPSSGRHPTRRIFLWGGLAAAAIVALAVGGSFAGFLRSASPPGSAAAASVRLSAPAVALLPLAHEPGSAEAVALARGLDQRLTEALARRPDLKAIEVQADTSVDLERLSTSELARRLGAEVLVRGRVELAGERAAVDLRVIDAARDRVLWQRRLESSRQQVHDLETGALAGILGSLLPHAAAEVASVPASVDPEAYRLLLQGRYLLSQGSYEAGLRVLGEAIEREPALAAAYAERARVLSQMGLLRERPREAAWEEGLRDAARALELDPGSPAAYMARGHILLFRRHDWRGASREFARALEMAPGSAESHYGVGAIAIPRNDLDLAVAELERARELDPLSPGIHEQLSRAHFFRREYGPAIEYGRTAVELLPHFGRAAWWLSRALWEAGDRDGALAMARQGGLDPEDLEMLSLLAAGDEAGARSRLPERIRLAGTGDGALTYRRWQLSLPALYAALLGDDEVALGELDRLFAYEVVGPLIFGQAHLDPVWDRLRDDPRFVRLVERSGAEAR